MIQNKFDEFVEKIDESVRLDRKQSFTDRIYNCSAIVMAILTIAAALVCLISFYTDQDIGIKIWLCAFYPMMLFIIVGTFFAVKEIIRNRYFSSVVACTLFTVSIILVITIIIIHIATNGKFYILPFTKVS